jgi:hypothetical protein
MIVAEHPSESLAPDDWVVKFAKTLQQFRESVGPQERYEYLLHDRDSIFAQRLDESIVRLGVKVGGSERRCDRPVLGRVPPGADEAATHSRVSASTPRSRRSALREPFY